MTITKPSQNKPPRRHLIYECLIFHEGFFTDVLLDIVQSAEPSSRRSPLASRIPWEAKRLSSGHFYCNQTEDISIAFRQFFWIPLDSRAREADTASGDSA
jgi:hypothetical protein